MIATVRALALVALAALPPAAAEAGVSGWAENPGGRMRLVVLPPDAQGIAKGAIEIETAEGWITYWREPGEAGTPPQMTIAPESGLSLEALRFPPPQVFGKKGMRDIGYDEPVALPFALKAEAGAKVLKAALFIGICKEICVPFQAEFEVPLKGREAEARAVVKAAEARLPEAPSARFFAEKPRIGAGGKTVTVAVTLPDPQSMPELFLTGPEGYVYFEPALERSGKGKTYATFLLEDLPRGYDLSGKTWHLLVKAGGRAMETPLVFD